MDVATTLNNIALVFHKKGDYAKAVENHKKCLEIRTAILGPETIDVATTLYNIGLVYDDEGEYAKAFEYYNKSLKIKNKFFWPDSSEVIQLKDRIQLLKSCKWCLRLVWIIRPKSKGDFLF